MTRIYLLSFEDFSYRPRGEGYTYRGLKFATQYPNNDNRNAAAKNTIRCRLR